MTLHRRLIAHAQTFRSVVLRKKDVLCADTVVGRQEGTLVRRRCFSWYLHVTLGRPTHGSLRVSGRGRRHSACARTHGAARGWKAAAGAWAPRRCAVVRAVGWTMLTQGIGAASVCTAPHRGGQHTAHSRARVQVSEALDACAKSRLASMGGAARRIVDQLGARVAVGTEPRAGVADAVA